MLHFALYRVSTALTPLNILIWLKLPAGTVCQFATFSPHYLPKCCLYLGSQLWQPCLNYKEIEKYREFGLRRVLLSSLSLQGAGVVLYQISVSHCFWEQHFSQPKWLPRISAHIMNNFTFQHVVRLKHSRVAVWATVWFHSWGKQIEMVTVWSVRSVTGW